MITWFLKFKEIQHLTMTNITIYIKFTLNITDFIYGHKIQAKKPSNCEKEIFYRPIDKYII